MRYIDANVFIYAYFKPKKSYGELSSKIRWMKIEAKKILEKLNKKEEEFCISLIQLSEIVNKLKIAMNWEDLRRLMLGLTSNNSLEIVEISKLLYINSIDKITQYHMDSNDISAYLIMKEKGITEIYTFDSHYQNLKDIICLPKFPIEFI